MFVLCLLPQPSTRAKKYLQIPWISYRHCASGNEIIHDHVSRMACECVVTMRLDIMTSPIDIFHKEWKNHHAQED